MPSERTEPATPKRIRDAQKRGQVPRSREFTSAAAFISLAIYLYYAAPYYIYEIEQMIFLSREFYDVNLGNDATYLFFRVAVHAVRVFYPILLIVITVALTANIGHIGLIFSFEVIKPSLAHVDMVAGAKKIFSKTNVFEFIKSSIKILVIITIVYQVVASSIGVLTIAPGCGLSCVIGILKLLIGQILGYTCVAFIVVACFDLVFQRLQYFNRLKMTREEVKQEYKETEGDPVIKSRRQQLNYELSAQQLEQGTEKATAVVINPTHLAVAFYYDAEKAKLPVITAKGRGTTANIIINVARRKKIPLFRNVPLAHSLYSQGRIGHYIPRDLIKPVAEVIRWINQIRQEQLSNQIS